MVDTEPAHPALQPLTIGPITLPRRVFLPAHSYNFPWGPQGSPELVAYLERRLRAGVPLAIVGEAEVPSPWTAATAIPPNRIAGQKSERLYEQLARLCARTNSVVFEQLNHPGGQVWFEERRPAFGPSSYPQARSYSLPDELSVAQIIDLQQSFVDAARTVWNNGLRGVEIKADQGKLFHQFLSREFNCRGDAYGGDFQARTRFLRETLQLIRRAAPRDFVVGVRLAGNVTGGRPRRDGAMGRDISLQETLRLCRELEAERLVDFVSISGETNSTVWGYRRSHGDETVPEGTFLNLGLALKEALGIPLFLSGRFLDIAAADRAIAQGACDAVGMARALIADAELLSHRDEPVRPCLSCNLSCVGRTWYGGSVRCIYDPQSGREMEISKRRNPASSGRKIAVVGAGPAGLEFARTAARLGAAVTLFEREPRIGGNLHLWSLLPTRSRVALAIDYWGDCLRATPTIRVELGVEISNTAALVDFDTVVNATGAHEVLPNFANASERSLTLSQALRRQDWRGALVAIIDGDRYRDPLAVALFLAERGARILVVTPYDMVGVGLDPVSRATRLAALSKHRVRYATWSDIRFSPEDGTPILYDHCLNRSKRLPALGHVVWCVNPLPNRLLAAQSDALAIGDALWPRGLEVATEEAFDTAYSLRR